MADDLDASERGAWVNQLRLRIDVRKWTAAKLRPAIWSARVAVDITAGISLNSVMERIEQANARVAAMRPDIEDVAVIEADNPRILAKDAEEPSPD